MTHKVFMSSNKDAFTFEQLYTLNNKIRNNYLRELRSYKAVLIKK